MISLRANTHSVAKFGSSSNARMQALVQAAEGSLDDQGVFRSCYAVMFFGVPNRGLDASSLTSMVRGQPNEYLVKNLDPSSPFLSLLHEMFYNKFITKDSQIICIFETKETPTVEVSPCFQPCSTSNKTASHMLLAVVS
jgi:hypothetical protein